MRHRLITALAADAGQGGLSLRDVAAAASVSPRSITDWEAGIHVPHWSHLTAWARALDRHILLIEDGCVRAVDDHIPQILPALREERGLTRADLADRMGVSYVAVSQGERGGMRALAVVDRHARALGCRLSLGIKLTKKDHHT